MGIVAGCYAIHLRCDIARCPRSCDEFIGENRRAAIKEARAKGWWVNKAGCLCPAHNRAVAAIAKRPNKESK